MGALEELHADECRRLLASRRIGRVAVNRRGRGPLVVPVNYVVDGGGGIVFGSDVGAKLTRIVRGAISFQVDDLDGALEHALACGARLAAHQPQEDVRVCLDPAGHPFCLWVDPSGEDPAGSGPA